MIEYHFSRNKYPSYLDWTYTVMPPTSTYDLTVIEDSEHATPGYIPSS